MSLPLLKESKTSINLYFNSSEGNQEIGTLSDSCPISFHDYTTVTGGELDFSSSILWFVTRLT